jgi:DNA-binding NtrC family response regulator
VLIVDDEPLIRWSLSETLADAGYTVVEAADRRSALDVFTRDAHAIALVLLDVNLPDSRDLGLLARLRELDPGCPVIMMTAHGSPELAEEAALKGAFRMVGKPFDMHQMVSLVDQALSV